METFDALARTFDCAAAVIDGVRPEQFDAATPCSEWDVRALLTHTVGVVMNIGCGVRGDPLLPDPNAVVLDTDVGGQFRAAAAGTLAAWRAAGLEGEVNIGAGPMPAAVGANINLVDTAAHTWDIARATGQPDSLPSDLAAAVLEVAHSVVNDDIRKFAGIAPARDVADDATPAEALAAFLGRAV